MEIGETLLVTSRQEWRDWLAQHHADRKEIWLVYYKKGSGKTGVSYEESVEEALSTLLDDPGFAAAARDLREQSRALPDPGAAGQELLALVGG